MSNKECKIKRATAGSCICHSLFDAVQFPHACSPFMDCISAFSLRFNVEDAGSRPYRGRFLSETSLK